MNFQDVFVNGETFSFPRCTSIIERGREQGLLVGDQWLTYNEETLQNGRDSHKLIQRYCEAKDLGGKRISDKEWDSYNEECHNATRGAIRFMDFTGAKTHYLELTVVSVTLGVVGHLDWIGTIKQHKEIIDWTTGAVNSGKKIQLGFYYLAYLEMFPRRSISGARVVQLNKKTGDFDQTIIELPELQQLANDFVVLRERIGAI